MFSIFFSVLASRRWLRAQSSTVIAATTASFFALWLSELGYQESVIIGLLALTYTVSFLVLMCEAASEFARYFMVVTSGLVILSALGVVPLGVSVCLYFSAISLCRDLFYIDLMSLYGELALRFRVGRKVIISSAMIMSVSLMLIASPLIGLATTYSMTGYVFMLGVVGLIFARSLTYASKDNSEPELCAVPSSIKWLCSLPLFVNSVVFLTRFLLVPYAILKMTKILAIEDGVFLLAGALISCSAAIGLLLNGKVAERYYRRDMYVGLVGVGISCLVISFSAGYLLQDKFAVGLVLFLVSFVSLECFSKIWTTNFIANLNYQAEECKSAKTAYKLFARFKAAGGACSYIVSFVLIDVISVYIVGCILAVFALLFAAAVCITRADHFESNCAQ
ncbi:hypothetical protein ACP3V3_02810 [Vibrio sp. PNB22_3_1]